MFAPRTSIITFERDDRSLSIVNYNSWYNAIYEDQCTSNRICSFSRHVNGVDRECLGIMSKVYDVETDLKYI